MIEGFSLKTAHLFGDALVSQARLRHRVFVTHRGLPHTHYDGMEYDEFDTPATTYLVWRDPAAEVRGLFRLIPTSMPYMLERYWPHLCESRALPKESTIWELGRVCVDRTYDPGMRRLIIPELLCALQEICIANAVTAVIGVTRKHLVDHYVPSGVQWLGPVIEIEGEMEAAFQIPVECLRPEAHCIRYGLPKSLLSLEPLNVQMAA